MQLSRSSGFNRLYNVRRAAARRYSYQNITFAAKTFDVAGKDVLEADVISAGRQVGRVRAERNGAKGGSLNIPVEPNHELGCQVLTIRRAASVSAKENLASVLVGSGNYFDCPQHIFFARVDGPQLYIGAFAQ